MKDLTWKSEYQVCVIAWKSLSGMIYMFMINTCIKFHNKNCPEQLLSCTFYENTASMFLILCNNKCYKMEYDK